MAVKVMVASAIENGALRGRASETRREGDVPRKPRRRRSSVFDSEGNEVFITLMCLKCHKMRPLSQFGLRRMADGAIRNQPWCRTCRSATGAERPRRRGSAEMAESHGLEVPPTIAPAPESAPEARRPGASVAAEVAAALAAGMRR